jgi:hypothetical protein
MRAAERSANRHHASLGDLRLRCSEMRSACSEIVLTGSCCALRLPPADLGRRGRLRATSSSPRAWRRCSARDDTRSSPNLYTMAASPARPASLIDTTTLAQQIRRCRFRGRASVQARAALTPALDEQQHSVLGPESRSLPRAMRYGEQPRTFSSRVVVDAQRATRAGCAVRSASHTRTKDTTTSWSGARSTIFRDG